MSNKNQFKTINQVEKFLAKKGLELTQTNIEKYFETGWWDNTINPYTNVYLSHKDWERAQKHIIRMDTEGNLLS
jgi:hypothetical protein